MKYKILGSLLPIVFTLIASPMAQAGEFKPKTVNVTIEPLGFLLGLANAQVNFKVSERVAIGPTLGLLSISSDGRTASIVEIGADAEIALNSPVFSSGFILNPSLTYVAASSSIISAPAIGGTLDFGYHWYWEGGLNLILAAGLSVASVAGSTLGVGASSPLLTPHLGLGIGLAF
ncbi:MAG: hypothetical protein ACO3A2_11650 [Bdellovibrionia bacterium]